ncbi:hypothetical protein BKA64DRAFT_638070 [Cadophora sp. MPI-SDFR-AT-0126]|nr:hypothetical protein BKA64DRAFT_638070 [Leotiomycetes sp. MPI-SDFR-AT-0126]
MSEMIWQNGGRSINPQLIFSACGFFGTYPTYTKVYREPQEPADLETRKVFELIIKMPTEIQLKIPETLPLHRGDLEVRLYYSHLLPLWIKTIPVRFYRYMARLLSADNMDHVGRFYRDDEPGVASDYANGLDVSRLRSLDNHSGETLRLRTYMDSPENVATNEERTKTVHAVDESSLEDAGKILLRNLTRFYVSDKENNLREAESFHGARLGDDIVPISCSRAHWLDINLSEAIYCPTCSKKTPARPFLIPLSFSVPVARRGQKETPDKYLLIYEDDLSDIFRNMEVAYRPIFWQTSFRRNLRRDSTEDAEFAEWMKWGCYTVKLGDDKHLGV